VPDLLLRQLLKTALFFTGFSLFFGFTVPAIDNAAHVGGLISGFLMGLLLAKPLSRKRPALAPAMLAHAGSVTLLITAITLAPPAYYNYQAQKQAEVIIREFITQEQQLMKEWRTLINNLQSVNPDPDAEIQRQLNRMLDEWSLLQGQTRAIGKTQEKARQRITLLHEYAGYRINNIRYLTRYIETGDDLQMHNISENTEKIKRVLAKLNK